MLPVQEAIVEVIAQHQLVIAKVVQSLNRSEISVGLKRLFISSISSCPYHHVQGCI